MSSATDISVIPDGLVAHHPWPVGWASLNITELLPDQRADTVLVAMMAMVPWQILAPDDLWLMGTALVALMGDTVVRRKHGQHRRRSEPRRRHRAARAWHPRLPFAHAAPIAERSAGPAAIIIERHFSFPSLRASGSGSEPGSDQRLCGAATGPSLCTGPPPPPP